MTLIDLQAMRRTIALGHRYFDIVDDDTPATGGGYYYPSTYGSVGTGDDAAAFQAAADAAELAGGGIVKTTPGVSYKLTQVQLGDNVHLDFTGSTLIRANAATATGIPNATIRNKDMTSGNTRIKVTGGEIGAQSSTAKGPHFGFYACTYLSLTDWLATSVYGDWNTKLRDCQFVEFGGTVDDGFGTTLNDGLHITGGNDILIRSGSVRTGDDSISLNVAQAQSPFPQSMSITRVVIEPHALRPSKSRCINILRPAATAGLGNSITNVIVGAMAGAHDNPAAPSGLSIRIDDAAFEKLISDITIGPFVIDATNGAGSSVTLQYCQHITLMGTIIAPGAHGLLADNVDHLTLPYFTVRDGRSLSQSGVALYDVTDFQYSHGYIQDTPQHGISLGRTPITVTGTQTVAAGGNLTVSSTTGLSVQGTLLLPNGSTTAYSAIVDGVTLTLSTGGTFTDATVLSPNPVVRWNVDDVTITNSSQNYALINGGYEGRLRNGHAPACSKGIVEAGNSDWNVYEYNDMSGVASTPLTITGSNSIGFRNRGVAGRITDTLGPNSFATFQDLESQHRLLPDLTSFSTLMPGNATAGSIVPNANDARWVRVQMGNSGTLHDVSFLINTTGGNAVIGVLDTGQAAASATRTCLARSGSLAVPANGWITFDPALTVAQGNVLEFFLSFDGTTAKMASATGQTASSTTPNSNFLQADAPGTSNGKLSGTIAAANVPATVGSTVTDGQMVQNPVLPLAMWRIA